MAVEQRIHHLIVNDGSGPVTVRVRFRGPIGRRLGIWPNTVTCEIVEPELDLLPYNRSSASVDIKIGTDTDNVTISGWRIVHVVPIRSGTTPDNQTARTLVYQLTLEDNRWQFQGDRGGILLYGTLNPTNPDGQPVPHLKKTNAELVSLCLNAMPLALKGGTLPPAIVASLNARQAPFDLEWYGVHAPTELQRILDHARHALALNQDGTYSIVRLRDPHEPFEPINIDPALKRPSTVQPVAPIRPGKCIIASCPTRAIVQRKSRLTDPAGIALVWVGVDIDGSIRPLEDLSWWPSGKTPIEVVRNNYADVNQDLRTLAEKSIYKMLRLGEDDLDKRWTMARRLIDDYQLANPPAGEIRQPITCRLDARIAQRDKHGAWVNQDTLQPVEGVSFDVETGVITSSALLVKVTGRSQGELLPKSVALSASNDLVFTFAHYPNGGVTSGETRFYEDYFMVPYQWDLNEGAKEITEPNALVNALADPGNVPVYNFDFLQLMYRERDDGTYVVDPVNLDALKTVAKALASAIMIDQTAVTEYREYHGMHGVDLSGSIEEIRWHIDDNITSFRLGFHFANYNEFARLNATDRQAKGGAAGPVRIAQTRGMLTGRTGSTGPASGNRAITRQAVPPLPGGGGGGGGGGSSTGREFTGLVQSYQSDGDNRWLYTIREIVKTDEGAGASAWENPTSYVEVQARNMFELFNTDTGMLGIGVTVAELDACAVQLRPIQPGNPPVQVREEIVYKSDGSVVSEYLFAVPNGIEDK